MKTDNSFFSTKVKLRIENLPDKDPIWVLDAFAGEGHIWNEVEKQSGREILYLGIDKQKKKEVLQTYTATTSRSYRL